MADTAKRIVGPAYLASANATLYTTPAATTTILRHIRIASVNSTSVIGAYLAINGAAGTSANTIFSNFPVPNLGAHDWSGFLVLHAGDTLQGYAGTASALTIVVSAVEVT